MMNQYKTFEMRKQRQKGWLYHKIRLQELGNNKKYEQLLLLKHSEQIQSKHMKKCYHRQK